MNPKMVVVVVVVGSSLKIQHRLPVCLQNHWDNSASTDSPPQRIKEKSRYGNSVSTPHRHYGHRIGLRTLLCGPRFRDSYYDQKNSRRLWRSRRGENPAAFPKARPIFQQPFSLPESAQTLAGIAFRAAGNRGRIFQQHRNLSAPHRCVCVCICDGHPALPVATSLRCDSWYISSCFVQ